MTIDLRPATNADAVMFDFSSSRLDQPLEISVSAAGFHDDSPGPVLYVLDGNTAFHTVAAIASFMTWTGQVPPIHVVGIGYPFGPVLTDQETNARWRDRRLIDLLFVDGSLPAEVGGRSYEGRGEVFLDVLKDELFPLVESEFNVDQSDRGVLAHSAAGNLAFGALLREPGLFRRVVATSAGPLLPDLESRFAELAGQWEAGPAPTTRVYLAHAANDIEGIAEAQIAHLEILDGLPKGTVEVESEVVDGEDHFSVWPSLYVRGLRSVYG